MPARKAGKKAGTFTKGDPRINRTKPGPGRPPEEFKQLCRDLASGDMTIANVRTILANPDDPKFVLCLRWATENGYGKAKETVEHQGGVTLRIEYGDSDE